MVDEVPTFLRYDKLASWRESSEAGLSLLADRFSTHTLRRSPCWRQFVVTQRPPPRHRDQRNPNWFRFNAEFFIDGQNVYSFRLKWTHCPTNGGLPAGEQLVDHVLFPLTDGIDEHEANHIFRVGARIQPHEGTAKRVTHEHIGP